MKRFIALTLAACLLLVLPACAAGSNKTEATAAPTAAATEPTAPTEPTAAPTADRPAETEPAPTTVKATAAAKKQQPEANIDVHLLNVFLSNFSELYTYEFSIDNRSTDKMLEFVILNAYFNSRKNFTEIEPVKIDGMLYGMKVSGDYVQERVRRYFNVTTPNHSVSDFYFDGTDYYIPAADGEQHFGFSKVTSIARSDNGELIVTYNVYMAPDSVDGIGTKSKIYYGYGSENTEGCRLVATGKAVLREKYFKENYANVTVVSMEHTENA